MKKARVKQGIPFWKVQGAGNDALIIESCHFPKKKSAFVQSIAHRTLGVGADQVLEVIGRGPRLEIQVWNCDGSRAEMCANGTRSFLKFARERGWVRASAEVLIVVSGQVHRAFFRADRVELSVGVPEIKSEARLSVFGKTMKYFPVSTGNPHAVIFLPTAKTPKNFDYRIYGSAIELHKNFPKKTNVEFVRNVTVRGATVTLAVEAWERGAGATLSCGSGAVAAAVAHRASAKKKRNIYKIKMTRFTLTVRFENDEAFLSGPSSTVAEGYFNF